MIVTENKQIETKSKLEIEINEEMKNNYKT